MRLRYGATIAGTFYPRGTEVIPASAEDIRTKTWLTAIEERLGGKYIGVFLPGRETPTLFLEGEIEV